nr:uncharacterized protein LOC104105970 [Nicotiana tomentosiformis]
MKPRKEMDLQKRTQPFSSFLYVRSTLAITLDKRNKRFSSAWALIRIVIIVTSEDMLKKINGKCCYILVPLDRSVCLCTKIKVLERAAASHFKSVFGCLEIL